MMEGNYNPKYASSTHRPTLNPSSDTMYPTNNGSNGARSNSVRMRNGKAVQRLFDALRVNPLTELTVEA